MIQSRPFPIGYGRLAFVAAAALFASPDHALSQPSPAMPIISSIVDFIGNPTASYFTPLGVKHIPDWIHTNLARNGLPDQQSVIADVARLTALDPQPIVYIDIEDLSFDIRITPQATVNANIAYFEQLIGWIRSANPCAKVAVYAIFPLTDYWAPNNFYTALRMHNDPWWAASLPKFQQAYQDLKAANAYLAPLAQKVDYIFPNLHAVYTNYQGATDGWPASAFATIAEAKKYNKPVYPFLWPEFQSNNAYIPEAYWKNILNFTRYYADGMVIWNSGRYHNEYWAPSDYWVRDSLALANSLSAPGALGGNIGVLATPPEGVYPSYPAQSVSLAAAGATLIRWSLTTTWPNYNYPTCSTGNFYNGPLIISTSEIILATACYPDGSSMSWDFAYVLK